MDALPAAIPTYLRQGIAYVACREDGAMLLELIREVQPAGNMPSETARTFERSAAGPGVPPCPKCSAVMVRRTNRRTGEKFWGCSAFPVCKGSR